MNKIVKNALILAAITLIAGLLLGAAHQVTLEPIQKQQEKETAGKSGRSTGKQKQQQKIKLLHQKSQK